MQYKLSTLALIGTLVLLLTSCSVSRQATREAQRLRVERLELRDSSLVERVEVHDTLREVTTITVDRNDRGDTLRQSIVTDRERIKSAADVRSKTVDVRVVRDTVYIERRDSVDVKEANISHQTSSISHLLKWIFAVLCAIIVLIIVIKLVLRRSLF